MEEQLISFETAKLAKEKNFRDYSRGWYSYKKGNPLRLYDKENYNGIEDCFLAPSQSFLQKWLREVHNIEVWATPYLDETKIEYNYMIINRNVDVYDLLSGDDEYKTYEEALEQGLLEALKLIKHG